MRWRVSALVVLLAAPALAQDADGLYRLYLNPSTLITASRLVGLGGASVGLAENTESLPFNYAAAGQRSPRRTRHWDWDFTFSLLTAPVPSMRDVDNEGTQLEAVAPIEGQMGAMIQFHRFGLGGYVRVSHRDVCLTEACGTSESLRANAIQGAVVFGFSVWQDQLAFGTGFNVAHAQLFEGEQGFGYFGVDAGVGVLYRPHHLPFRIGASVVSRTLGEPTFTLTPETTIAGRPAFSEVVTPARVSLGASVRLGPGSERFNRLSAPAIDDLGPEVDLSQVPHDEGDDPSPPGRWLLTAQLDLIFPVKNAIILNSFIDQQPRIAGEQFSLVPRVGAEYEMLPHRLRARAGFYLEPPFLQGALYRPHVTVGAELYVLKLLGVEWSLSTAVDLAPRYFSLTFGIGWWSEG